MKRLVVCVCLILSILFFAFMSAGIASAATIFVDQNALGSVHDGQSWQTAFITVSEGLNAAISGDEIWVAKGIYNEYVQFKDGTALYGGFGGAETARDQRDWNANVTILESNVSNYVVTMNGCGSQATRIDGFTIRNGAKGGIYAPYSNPTIVNNTIADNKDFGIYIITLDANISNNNITNNNGAGIRCYPSSNQASACTPTISNNLISGNYGAEQGGGILCYVSAKITNNVIANNTCYYYGGGICVRDYFSSSNAPSPIITNNTITGNVAGAGGGIMAYNSSESLIANNIISKNNVGVSHGAGIWSLGPHLIISNIIVENKGGYGGGIATQWPSTPTAQKIINNTISGNTATEGGGIYVFGGAPTILNNIVAFGSSGIYIYPDPSSVNIVINNNDVYQNAGLDYSNVLPGSNDISIDPQFLDRANGNYHVQYISPCLDKGDNSVVQTGWLDTDGEARSQGRSVDIGADETPNPVPFTVVSTDPTDGATQVPLDKTIAVVFSENIQPGNYNAIKIIKGNKEIAFNTPHISGNILYIKPTSNLSTSSNYKVTIGVGAVKDIQGYLFPNSYSFSFATVKK